MLHLLGSKNVIVRNQVNSIVVLVNVVEVDTSLSGREESQHRLLGLDLCWDPTAGHSSEVGNFEDLSDHL